MEYTAVILDYLRSCLIYLIDCMLLWRAQWTLVRVGSLDFIPRTRTGAVCLSIHLSCVSSVWRGKYVDEFLLFIKATDRFLRCLATEINSFMISSTQNQLSQTRCCGRIMKYWFRWKKLMNFRTNAPYQSGKALFSLWLRIFHLPVNNIQNTYT